MARARIEMPDAFPFSTEMRVRINDLNYGHHVGNDTLLALVHEARIRFLAQHGFSETDTAGSAMIMTDAVVIYKAQAFYGDVLRIEVAVTDLTRTGCDFLFRLSKKDDGTEVARAKTGIAFFDYKNNRVVRVPDAFRSAFSG